MCFRKLPAFGYGLSLPGCEGVILLAVVYAKMDSSEMSRYL